MNKDIHTTNIVGAWVEGDRDYFLANDLDAYKKLFWCLDMQHVECFRSASELWAMDPLFGHIWQNPSMKIKAWAYITGPNFKKGKE